MAKPEIIKSNRKRTFRFSNFKNLEKGLEIAIGLKWSTFIITGVAEDKKELVEDWINNNRGKYKGINISLGSTYSVKLNYSSTVKCKSPGNEWLELN